MPDTRIMLDSAGNWDFSPVWTRAAGQRWLRKLGSRLHLNAVARFDAFSIHGWTLSAENDEVAQLVHVYLDIPRRGARLHESLTHEALTKGMLGIEVLPTEPAETPPAEEPAELPLNHRMRAVRKRKR